MPVMHKSYPIAPTRFTSVLYGFCWFVTLSIEIFVTWRQQNQAETLKKFLSFLTHFIEM